MKYDLKYGRRGIEPNTELNSFIIGIKPAAGDYENLRKQKDINWFMIAKKNHKLKDIEM